MKPIGPPLHPRASHLALIEGGKADEARAARDLYPIERRVVRAEPRPEPNPPRAA